MNDILDRITKEAIPGTVIPKPEARSDYIVKGWGKRRGESALIYKIPNHKAPMQPYEKGITESEWKKAFCQLMTTGNFSHAWFKSAMPACAKEGPCNFTTIGGIFGLLSLAKYHKRGEYRKV